jgi:GNAT superfamily N-acetyltransferase
MIRTLGCKRKDVALARSFQRESLRDVIDEVRPLLEQHWQEVAHYPDIPLTPNWFLYEQAELFGILRIYTGRDDGQLIGYSVFMVHPGVHYMTSKEADEDLLFVAPDYRNGRFGLQLMQFAERELAVEEVQLVKRRTKVAERLNFGRLLERMGYEPIDVVYGKRLDKRT